MLSDSQRAVSFQLLQRSGKSNKEAAVIKARKRSQVLEPWDKQ